MPPTHETFIAGVFFTLGAIAAIGVVLLIETLLGVLLGWLGGVWRQTAYYRRHREPHWGLPLARVVRWLDRWLRR